MRYVAFFEDGSTFDGPPESCPDKVVCIAHEDGSVGTRVIVGDWFCFYGGRWWNHDLQAMLSRLREDAARFRRVIQGWYVLPDSKFLDLQRKAREVVFN